MKKKIALAVVALLLLTSAALADKLSLDQLKERADRASKTDQPKACINVVDEALRLASAEYDAGDVEKGRADITSAADYAEKGAHAAIDTGKHLKDTELHLGRASRTLQAIQHKIEFDERELVRAAVTRIEAMRTQLLNRMFAK